MSRPGTWSGPLRRSWSPAGIYHALAQQATDPAVKRRYRRQRDIARAAAAARRREGRPAP